MREAPAANERARASLLVGALGVAVAPGAVALWRLTDVSLVHGTAVVTSASVIGLLAVLLARSALRQTEITIGRVGGARVARVGRALGLLALCLGLTAALTLAFFGLLLLFAS